jgi:hypothetical protein
MEKFQAEIELYRLKINQYEKDRETWEKQMKQMKAQFNALESTLEEKEIFIKQYIQQPISQTRPEHQNSYQQIKPDQPVQSQPEQPLPMQGQVQVQPAQQSKPAAQQEQSYQQQAQQISQQQNQQQFQQQADWFQRMMQQQRGYQPLPKSQNSQHGTMDFFTLRNKTTQPTGMGNYGNQR